MIRSILIASAVTCLTACASPDVSLNDVRNGSQAQPVSGGNVVAPAAPAPAATVEASDPGVAAFRDICLATAPSFANATNAAAAYGVADFLNIGDLSIGSRADNTIAVQLTAGSKCVITTPSRATNPRDQFLSIVPGLSTTSALPATTTIGGSTFIIQHDRQGGEAFVMLKR